MLATIRCYMDEIEVINILKRCSDKKAERLIKSAAFLFAAIWLHLAHFWSGVKYMCNTKYKHLEIDKYIKITFSLQRHLNFLKDLLFVFFFFFPSWLLYASE